MEEPTLEAILEQMKKKITPEEFREFYEDLFFEGLSEEIEKCSREGDFELEFRNNYCGLNLLANRPVQCPYLDLKGKYLDLILSDDKYEGEFTYRIYHCKRRSEIIKSQIEEL